MRPILFLPTRLSLFAIAATVLAPLVVAAPTFAQQSSSAADFLPATTAIYLHVEKPAELFDTIENHALVEHVLKLEQMQDLMLSPQFAAVMFGRSILEAQFDESVFETLKANSANGLWLAVDTKSEGVMLLFQAKEEARLKRVAGTILEFVKSNAEREGKDIPFKRVDYRDAVAAKFDDFLVARYRNWFAITNKPNLAKAFVDNQIDGIDSPLSRQAWFRDAVAKRGDADIWAAVDMKTVRKVADNQKMFSGRTDNPAVEMVFGGILDLLKNAPVASAELKIGKQIDLSLAAPFDANWATEAREFFYGKNLGGLAPKSLTPKNMIANLTSYRDVGLWWLSKEELYAENVIAQLTQADSQLSTIFSGMNFGEDVLGALEPGVQIVVTENTYDSKYVPDVKIPAFALVGKLKDVRKMQRKLKIAFQSVIGFVNINLGMNGQPQLDLETEKLGDTKLLSASYFYEDGTEKGLMLFNFAPTIAFHDSHLIVSSNRELAVELSELLAIDAENQTTDSNTKLKIDGQTLHQILSANSESLIAQNMLEEGNDRVTAAQEIQVLLLAVDLLRDAQLDYRVTDDEMKLDFSIRFEVE